MPERASLSQKNFLLGRVSGIDPLLNPTHVDFSGTRGYNHLFHGSVSHEERHYSTKNGMLPVSARDCRYLTPLLPSGYLVETAGIEANSLPCMDLPSLGRYDAKTGQHVSQTGQTQSFTSESGVELGDCTSRPTCRIPGS